MKKLKLGILGSGFLAEIIAKAWKNGFLEDYELVGITGRNYDTASKLAKEVGTEAFENIDALLAQKPDYVAEAAAVAAVKNNAVKILSADCNMVVLSIGAFADNAFYEEVKKTASEHGTRVHIASGAVGGFDVLRTVSLMGQAKSQICTHKGPNSLRNTPLFEDKLMEEEKEVFSGNARDAIALLPTKVNVAVAASLATTGPSNTHVSINSVPGFIGDDHCITAEIEGVKAVVDIYSSTSAIAGWSVVAALRNIVSPIAF